MQSCSKYLTIPGWLWLLSAILAIASASELRSEAPVSELISLSSPVSQDPRPIQSDRFSSWPYRWQVGNFNVYSTVSKSTLQATSEQLLALPPQIEMTLGVKLKKSDVHLVVLADQPEFERYLQAHFPTLPNRRALYVQRRGMGVVITYHHPDWLTDARHECTHALLHQSGIHLPLWLDEGLAEYFETHGQDPRFHPEHRQAIQMQLRFGQIAQIDDFENNELIALDSKDYKNSWGVVTFLIHHSDETRSGLSTYINDLHRGTAAGYLSRRLSLIVRRNWRHQYESFYAPAKNELASTTLR